MNQHSNRRQFIRNSAIIGSTLSAGALMPLNALSTPEPYNDEINIVGPKAGYSPQIGTLVSMMDWMRSAVLNAVTNLTTEQLDYLHDEKSNSIGSMLLHLAATERYYQIHTFEGKKWGSWDDSIKKQWDIPMQLGEKARDAIKGKDLNYYLNTLSEVREASKRELRNRDDKWLMSVDKEWFWGPTNNYCKWFHVVEHESNHNGQMKWIRSRISGAPGAGG
jgi:uncharacterized damage-inducible protein DinB